MPENPPPEEISGTQTLAERGKALGKLVLEGVRGGKWEEILVHAQKAVAIYEELTIDDPSPGHRSELATALNRLAAVHGQLKHSTLHAELSTRSLSFWRALYEESPNDYRHELASSLISFSTVLAELKDPVSAFKSLDEALGLAVEIDLAPRKKGSFSVFARLPLVYEEAFSALPNPAQFQLRTDLGMLLVEKLISRFYDEDDEQSFNLIMGYVHFSKVKKDSAKLLNFQRLLVSKMYLKTNLRTEQESLATCLRLLADCACGHFLKIGETQLREEAIASSDESVRITRAWVGENGPEQARAELSLAACIEHLCLLRYRLRTLAPNSLELLGEAEHLIRKQTSIAPADKALLARILFKKARLPQVPNGLELTQEACATYTVLHQNDATKYQAYYLVLLAGLAKKYREKKMWNEGLAASETALSILKEETPQRADWLFNKAEFHKKLSFHSKDAVEAVNEHIRIYRHFFDQDRSKYLKHMADALREGAGLLFLTDNKKAHELIIEAIVLLKELCSKDVACTNALASALSTQSNIAVQLQDYGTGLRAGRECIQVLDDFGSKADPDILARALYSLGRKKLEGKSVEESTAMQRRSLEIRKRLVQETSGRAKESHLMDLARTLESLGDVLRFAGRIDEARTMEQAEVAAREALVPFDRKRHYPEVASALEYQFNKNPEHVHLLERAISIYRETSAEALHERGPNCLSRCLHSLAGFRLAKGEVQLAAEAAEESVELIRKFKERLPSELLDGLLALAKVQAAEAKWEHMASSLRESFQECLKVDNPLSKQRGFIEMEPKARALIVALPVEQAALAASLTAELESMGHLKNRVVFPKCDTAPELD